MPLCQPQIPYDPHPFSAVSILCFPMCNTNYKEKRCKIFLDIDSLCAIFCIESVDRLTLPVSLTMAAVCSVKMFYIAGRMEEEESWLSVYCGTIGKCQVCK